MTSRMLIDIVVLSTACALLAGCPPDTPPVTPEHDAGLHADAATPDSAGVDSQQMDAATDDQGGIDAGADSGEPACENECSPATQICDGTTGFRLCGQYDLDPCLELSPSVSCAVGYGCTDGRCVPSCRNECPVGGTLCQDATHVLACGNFDTDPCLDLGAAIDCGSGRHCEAGQCVLDGTACSNECSASGIAACFGDAVRTCGQSDGDSCLDLSPPVSCDSGQVCRAGACVAFCLDECSSSGATECAGNGVRTCGETDADGCLEWSAPVACTAPATCSVGVCAATCTNDCSNNGSSQCSSDSSGVSWCGQFDSDACLDLSTPTPCPLGYACNGGICVPTCANDCSLGGTPRCGGDGHSVETCGNYDQDVCAEWGGAVTCPGGATCSNGSCNTPCTDGCSPADLVECVSGNNATHTCGQWDLDSCLEWTTTPALCETWQVCTVDQCVTGATPATILVNEILYNPNGTDNAAGNNLFVELWGPANQSLDGFELVGVNGNAGVDYNRISLDGEVLAGDGFYLIAHPSGDATLVALADLTSNSVDYQNGPDSLQLRWHGRVVDAVAYGVFGGSDVFAGEGNPAPSSGQGNSLSRNAAHDDTDDNSVDFSIPLAPSPRGDPPACVDACTTDGATRCNSTLVENCGDHNGDGCREWSSPATCPNAGDTCQGTACAPPVCTPTCTRAGDTHCNGIQVETCNSVNSCLLWSAPANCQTAGEYCQGTACAPRACSDACTPAQSTRCNGTQIETCRDVDSDQCLEWSGPVSCPIANEICQGTTCSLPCTNECPNLTAAQCAGSQIQRCGNPNGDACYEWLAPVNCPTNQTCLNDTCQLTSAPEVVMITPQGTIQTTQGNSHRILVDATAYSGRSITKVEYFADNVKQGETTASPHQMLYTVPANALTNSNIAIQAKATDNMGVVGASTFAYLAVRNDFPVARFTPTITNIVGQVGTVTVDASAVSDTETATGNLEVCWDWDNSGNCDTFSTTKIATHDYAVPVSPTSYTIRMVVRDAVGQTHSTTRNITFSNIRYLGGQTLTSDLWYGTIVVTGDLVVGSGQTLTVAADTQVLFVFADTNIDTVGDYTLTVDGRLDVQGSAGHTVFLTGQDATAKRRGGWDRIVIQGSPASSLSYAIIEYADVGLEIKNGSTLDHVTVRTTRGDCVLLTNGDNASLTDVALEQCGGNGMSVTNSSTGVSATRLAVTDGTGHGVALAQSSSLAIDSCTLSGNGVDGARASTGCTLGLDSCTIEDNTGAGVTYESSANGIATHNQVRRNGKEGVSLLETGNGRPNPIINFNNIYSNATGASLAVGSFDSSSTLVASISGGDSSSSTYTAPAGKTIRRVYISYSEGQDNSSNYVYARLLNGSNGSTIQQFDGSYSGWVFLAAAVTSLRVAVHDGWTYSATDTITGNRVELVSNDGATDVSAAVAGGAIDLRYNYLGTFPNVLTRVALTQSDSLNLQGFVGELFDGSWSTGIYKAGPQTTATWSGTIYVTGDTSIAAGQAITLAAGTHVLFVDHDQDGDNAGDFTFTANGKLDASGAAGTEVLISGQGTPTGDVFQSVVLSGSSGEASAWGHVIVEHARNGVTLRGNSGLSNVTVHGGTGDGISIFSAAPTLTDVSVDGAGDDGIVLDNADSAQLLRVTSELNGGDGIEVGNGSTGLSLGYITSRQNTGHGLHVRGGSTPAVADSTLRQNNGHGARVLDSSPNISYSLLTYNHGAGLSIEGSGSTDAQHNVIKYNDDTGAAIWSAASGTPTPTLQYSNIYGNAVVGANLVNHVDTSATLVASIAGGDATSSTYSAPAGSTIRSVRVTYSEGQDNSSNYVYARLLNGSTSATIQQFDGSFSGWIMLPAGVTSLRVSVHDGWTYSATDTITVNVSEVTGFVSSPAYELAAVTQSGTTLAKFNYWTFNAGDVPTKIFQARTNSVDYTGYIAGSEYPGDEVGPRP